MYRHLEKHMKPSLHRDESLSEEATRRRAVSFVIDDDSRYNSQSLGSFADNKLAEPNRARVEQLKSKESSNKKSMLNGQVVGEQAKARLAKIEEKALNGQSVGGHRMIDDEETGNRRVAQTLKDDDARLRLEQKDFSVSRTGLAQSNNAGLAKAEAVQPPGFSVARRGSQPGAFAQRGLMARHESSCTLGFEENPPQQTELLVDAELVSDREVRHETKQILVEASPQEPPSVCVFIKTNREVQFGLCGVLLALCIMSIGLGLALTIGQKDTDLSTAPTSAPTSLQDMALLELLIENLPLESAEKLTQLGSSQYKAMAWLQADVQLEQYSDDRILQRFAMATLFYATLGPSLWQKADGWLTADHECTWYTSSESDSCLNDTLVTLNLYENGVGGIIPVDISLLTGLKTLIIDSSRLGGTIPASALSRLSDLEILSLDFNYLSGSVPSEIGLLTSLQELSMEGSVLDGTLPTEVGKLTNILYIDFDDNLLHGELPSELGLLTKLESFYLSYNQLSGTLSSTLGNLGYLTKLTLNDNALTGTLPWHLGRLVSMQYLSLPENKLKGSIPSTLGRLTDMDHFSVDNNTLTGIIPTELTSIAAMEFFSVYANEIDGTLPSEVGLMTNLRYLYLDQNKLSGSLPSELGLLTALDHLYLDQNKLSGSLPSELGMLTALDHLWAEQNSFTGRVPQEFCDIQLGVDEKKFDCHVLDCSCLIDNVF